MKKLIPLIFILIPFYSSANECKTIDLSSKDNVLEGLKVTNQNGLGTCHIEQLQRMLQAKMPGHPSLARISMAIHEKAKRDEKISSDQKKAIRWMDGKAGLPGGTYIDAGNSCEAFELLKNQEICESEFDQFENLSKRNSYDQKKILDALSMYFDDKSPLEKFEFLPNKEMLAHEFAFRESIKFCKIPSNVPKAFINAYKKAGGTSKNVDALKEFQLSTYLVTSNFDQYISKIVPDLIKIMERTEVLDSLLVGLINLLKAEADCAHKNFSGFLGQAEAMCSTVKPNQARVLSLTSIGLNYKDLHRLLNKVEDRDDYFKNASVCFGKKHKIPSSLKCSTINLLRDFHNLNDKKKYQAHFSKTVGDALMSNTPVGISVCTRFFKHPEVTTIKENGSYGCGKKDDPDYKAGEGSHAVTIVGKRCKEGKTEFYVHNSWGTGCGYYSDKYECSKKGGFWVDSEILSMNARNLNILK